GHFDFDDVAREINAKLVRRHPHVFGPGRLASTEQVLAQWDVIKAEEKRASGKTEAALFKPLPPRLPALMFAETVWKQIEKQQLPAGGAVDAERVAALAAGLDDEQLGRMLFELAAAARQRRLDPEGALRRRAEAVVRQVSRQAAGA
ncbi:MAG TPA: MazG nucleotide pyrophosphohydrolase domain-containing protein, partial [Opitutaceae bacterium]|nr:MazG nucleotide pyrophosphohydrolase domain-containing protein [Opitutaceae bacterium]